VGSTWLYLMPRIDRHVAKSSCFLPRELETPHPSERALAQLPPLLVAASDAGGMT
jgi:hypothetical protein